MKETYKGWTAEQYSAVYADIRGELPATVDSLNKIRSFLPDDGFHGSLFFSPWAKAAFDAAREAGLLDPVAFPQPELKAPEHGTPYFYSSLRGKVYRDTWDGSSFGYDLLKAGHAYLTKEAAEQRLAWDAQQMKRYVAPQWFRDLGPEFLSKLSNGDWVKKKSEDFTYFDMDSEDFKPLPKDVVHVLNGKEYRWPALVTEGARYWHNTYEIFEATGNSEGHKNRQDAINELEYYQMSRIDKLRGKR